MSRVGNKPIKLNDVTITLENNEIIIEGKKGKLAIQQLSGIEVKIEEGIAIISRNDDNKQTKANGRKFKKRRQSCHFWRNSRNN